MCPFRNSNCGNHSAFLFSQAGEQQTINISLPQGETCTFQIQADCGLPAFKPNDTTGFEIETLDYDDDDLSESSRLRLLKSKKPEPPKIKNDTPRKPRPENKTDDGSHPAKNGSHPPKNESGPGKKKQDAKNGRHLWGGKNAGSNGKNFGTTQKPPKVPKNITVKRGDDGQAAKNGTKKGPMSQRFNPNNATEGKFKGGKPDDMRQCKKRYQQISVTALGNSASSSSRVLQTGTPVYTMALEVGTTSVTESSGKITRFLSGFLGAILFISLLF